MNITGVTDSKSDYKKALKNSEVNIKFPQKVCRCVLVHTRRLWGKSKKEKINVFKWVTSNTEDLTADKL